jgi:hypothetical protein
MPPTDEELHKYRRAREVLSEASWVVDEFVNVEMRNILTSEPADTAGREIAYTRARVATEMLASLNATVDSYEFEEKRQKARAQ